MTLELVCWRCGNTLKNLPRRIPRLAECSDCRVDLHVCMMCRHYAPRYGGQCSHDRAERVQDKKKSNFCTYFRPRPNAHLPPDGGAEEATRTQLGALFGDVPSEEDTQETAPAPDRAMGDLTDLFGLDSGKGDDSQSEEEMARQQLGSLFSDSPTVSAPAPKEHHVFVYGTLKRGFPNHDAGMAMADYVGRFRTFFAFPLVVGGPWFSPYLIDEPGTGLCVTGELFCVDDEGLAALDGLEGAQVADGYRRIEISVHEVDDAKTREAWTYVKTREDIDGIHGEPMEEYELDPRYVAASKRTSEF